MRALKSAVVSMAVLLLIGVGALLGVVIERNLRPPAAASPVQGAPAPSFGKLGLGSAPGTRIQEMATADGLLILRLTPPAGQGEERVVVVEPRTGRVIGTIAAGDQP